MDSEDDADNGAQWAAHELSLEHLHMILHSDPGYAEWLDRLEYQAELERVQLRLPFPSHTH